MKKLGLLIAVGFLLTSCDIKPGGNKGVLPETHDGNIEQAEQTAKPAEQPAVAPQATEPTTEAKADSTAAATASQAAEKKAETEN